jgi:hypothetical protein
MSFIQSFAFKAELTKPAVMEFIARTPAEFYFLVISSDGSHLYGMVMNMDVIEYLTNEFAVKSLEFISPIQVKQALTMEGYKKVGNHSLLEL